jgi:uncharacterized protein YoxC
MAVITDTVLTLAGVVFLLAVGFAIPCIVQIRRTARDMTLTLRTINENLPVIMKHLEEITARVNRTTVTVQGQFADLSQMIKKLNGVLFLLVGLEEIVRRKVRLPFVPTLGTLLAVSKGVRVFLSHLLSERRCG